MSEYAEGTVAVATVRGKEGVRVLRADDPLHPWRSTTEVQGTRMHSDRDVFTVRPLVVLDPEDAAFVKFVEYHGPNDAERPTGACAASYGLADLLREQTKPPRIPEPGLWGVVEATSLDIARRRWVHHEEERWVADTGAISYWESLIDPVLIREGVDA